MNNYTIKLTVLLLTYNTISVSGEQQNGFWSRLYSKLPFVGSQSFHVGGAAIEDLNKLRGSIKKDVQEIITDVVKQQAEEFCANAAKGAFDKLTPEKQYEIGANIGQGLLDKLTPEKTTEIGNNLGASFGEKFGENLVKGIATGAVGVAVKSGEFLVDKTVVAAKTTATATQAAAETVFSAPGASIIPAAIAVVGYYHLSSIIASGNRLTFRRCLNTNFNCPDLNNQGFPKRCDSPERKSMQWDAKGTSGIREKFRTMKRNGQQPKGEDDLNQD